jgi:type I restriction-modification system DNA methylase subunit
VQRPGHKKFISLLRKVDYSKRMHEVFEDFCTLGTYSLASPFYPEIAKEEFKRIHERYTQEQIIQFDEAFTLMVNEMEAHNDDFLGEIYQQCELGNDRLGQIFTPFPVSMLLAQITMGDLAERIKQEGFITLNEPTCGSGGMVIAFRKAMIDAKCNPSRDVFVTAQDISEVAFKMCYIQLSLYGMGASVIHGDTLRMEIWRELSTPVYWITDWPARLMLRSMKDLCEEQPEEEKARDQS